MMFGLYSKIAAAIVLSVFLAGVYWRGHTSGYKARETIAKADDAARVADALQAEQQAREKESRWQRTADKIRGEKNAQINSLGLELAESLKRLRNRPDRPVGADVPKDTGVGSSCTGASLWREDGEFLRREAARADGIRAALDACQQAYRALTLAK